MKILVISDSHKDNEKIQRVLDIEGRPDFLIHCGDVECDERIIEQMAGCPCVIVSGNNDFFYELPREKMIELEGFRIFVTHGHYYFVSMGPERIINEALDRRADLVIFGHTHRPMLLNTEGITVLNPGSVAYPRQEGRNFSYAVLELERGRQIACEIRHIK